MNAMEEQRADAITAEMVEAFTVACAKASAVPGATAGDCYRAGLAAAMRKEDPMNDTTEPQAGDHVILRGTIRTIHEGVALVEVYRTYPVGGTVAVQCGALELDESEHDGGSPAVSTELSDAYGLLAGPDVSFRRNNMARDYAARRLAEIKTRHYPNGDTLQMIADFEWLIDEVEYLRRTSEPHVPAAACGLLAGPDMPAVADA